MKTIPYIALWLAVTASGFSPSPLAAQEAQYQVTDFVELPEALKVPGDSACFIEFGEQWTFPEKGALMKEVRSQNLTCSGESRPLSLPDETLRIRNISYEFVLLDPHLAESDNRAFPEADSMDLHTRSLQARLIALIEAYGPMASRYDPGQELLSVYFHEEWVLDPASRFIHKKVREITPVIWQKRQTTEGISINDGDTDLPVYYKTLLQRIPLRQP